MAAGVIGEEGDMLGVRLSRAGGSARTGLEGAPPRGAGRTPAVALGLLLLVAAGWAEAQPGTSTPHVPGMPMSGEPISTPFYREWTFHILVGLAAAAGGVLAHRTWSRRHWRRPPAGMVSEAVLAVDLVGSTQLATHYGDGLAMRTRNLLEASSRAAARSRGVTSVETTGDGSMMTFPSVVAAVQTAVALLRGFREGPPDPASGSTPHVRAAVTYGEILLDARGARHGAAINRAFRLMGVTGEAFVRVDGEACLTTVPDRNRILLDEEAVDELEGAAIPFRQIGVCRLKGFTGFHRVYEVDWNGA